LYDIRSVKRLEAKEVAFSLSISRPGFVVVVSVGKKFCDIGLLQWKSDKKQLVREATNHRASRGRHEWQPGTSAV